MQLPTKKTEIVRDFGKYTFLIYGQPKAGKTTFCANFPQALFIATEPGHKFQEVFKVDPLNWQDVVSVARELASDKTRKFKTVIFDTVDNAWLMCEEYVCKKEGITHVSEGDYGSAYQKTRNEFMRIIRELTQRGYGVVFISHAQTKDQTRKEGVVERKISMTDSTLGNTARKAITGLCDMIFYCWIDSTGKRLMRTKADENTNAGDRSGLLPDMMALDYGELRQHLSGKPKIIPPKTMINQNIKGASK